jgi:hypothetical protein
MQDKIKQLNKLYTSLLCKQLGPKANQEVVKYVRAYMPRVNQLKAEIEAAGYQVNLHSVMSFFEGGPATTIAKNGGAK